MQRLTRGGSHAYYEASSRTRYADIKPVEMNWPEETEADPISCMKGSSSLRSHKPQASKQCVAGFRRT